MKLSQQLLRFDVFLSAPWRRPLSTAAVTKIGSRDIRSPRKRQSLHEKQHLPKSRQPRTKKTVHEVSAPPSLEGLCSAVKRQSVSLTLKELVSVSMVPGPYVRVPLDDVESYEEEAAISLSSMSSMRIKLSKNVPPSFPMKEDANTVAGDEMNVQNPLPLTVPSSTLNKEIIKLVCRSASIAEMNSFRNILKTRCIFRIPWDPAVPAMKPATDRPLLLFDLDIADVNELIRACIRSKSIRQAVEWLLFVYERPIVGETARPLRPNRETFDLLIPAAAKRMDWSDLLLVLSNARLQNSVDDNLISSRQYDVLIKRCQESSHSRWQHALQFYSDYVNTYASSIDCGLSSAVIRTLISAQRYKEAENFILQHKLLELQPLSQSSSVSNALTKELFIEISRILVNRSREQDLMRLVGKYLNVNNFLTPPNRPSVSKAIFDVMDELSASVDVGINSSDALFTAAAIASCSDAYNFPPTDKTICDSIEALWAALARSSSIDADVSTEALQVLCRLIADMKDSKPLPPSLTQIVKTLSLTTHTSPVGIASSTPLSTLPDLISILSAHVDDLPLAMEAYRHLNDQGKLLDKARYKKLAFALSRGGRHKDVLEMFDRHLRLSDDLLAHRRDVNISERRAMAKKQEIRETKVYHHRSRSTVIIKEPVERNEDLPPSNESIVTAETEDIQDHRPLPLASIAPELIHSVIPSLAHMGEIDVIKSLLLEEMPSRGTTPHIRSIILMLKIMYNDGKYNEVADVFINFWNDCVLQPPPTKSKERFVSQWKVTNSQAEALVDVALKCCKESGDAQRALEVMILWEKFTACSNALDVDGLTKDTRSRWYAMVSQTLAKDKNTFENLPLLIGELKNSAVVPPKALLDTCLDLCKEVGDKTIEERMIGLMNDCGYGNAHTSS